MTPEQAQITRLLAGGQHGKLHTPVGEQLPVRVFEHGDELMLVLLVNPDGGLEDDAAVESLLEYTSPRGLVRFHGDARLEERDLIRFSVADSPEVVQRREFVRVDAPQPVVVATKEGEAVDTHAIDISGGGMLLRGAAALELGASVRFRVYLGPREPAIEGRARVVRAGPGSERALMFEELSPEERQRLIRFAFDRQRAALAKTRGYVR